MDNYLELPFQSDKITPNQLKIERAIGFFLATLQSQVFTSVDFLRTESAEEIIIGWIKSSIGQKPLNDIRFQEKIAILFDPKDKNIPKTFALREDFPHLLHLNTMEFEKPRNLCIYEKSFEELKLDWRSVQFIQDISKWMEKSAYDDLHQEDQVLEPFLMGYFGTIILPNDLEKIDTLFVQCITKNTAEVNFIASEKQQLGDGSQSEYLVVKIEGWVQEHKILNKTITNLLELNDFLSKVDLNLYEILKGNFSQNKLKENCQLIIIASLPKKDKKRLESDYYAFVVNTSIKEIGDKLNILQGESNKKKRDIRTIQISNEELKGIKLLTLKPVFEFNKENATLYNGIDINKQNIKIALIGAGALGANVFNTLSRMGFGKWTILDKDILLPHNLARHELGRWSIARSKSQSISFEANFLLSNKEHSKAIWDDFLNPEDLNKIKSEFINSEIIVDASASIAVQREITNENYGNARRISIFFNSNATDLVFFAEDSKRLLKLDNLEFQYYKYVLQNEELHNHFKPNEFSIRYANSCADISSRLPNDYIVTLSAIASNQLRKIEVESEAQIGLWRIYEEDFSIKKFNLPVIEMIKIKKGEWEIIVDIGLIEKISSARKHKLPNETGGILIGGYDMLRKRIYIVETILSPNDSHEYPTSYVRGIEEVEEQLKKINNVTNGQLKYVGEWHSHPNNASLNQSTDDKDLFHWLKVEMNKIGLPPLMIILGEKNKFEIYID